VSKHSVKTGSEANASAAWHLPERESGKDGKRYRAGTLTGASTKGETMIGEPTFFEMGVADTARARAFYSGLFGWRL
jgi:hypothetical protein